MESSKETKNPPAAQAGPKQQAKGQQQQQQQQLQQQQRSQQRQRKPLKRLTVYLPADVQQIRETFRVRAGLEAHLTPTQVEEALVQLPQAVYALFTTWQPSSASADAGNSASGTTDDSTDSSSDTECSDKLLFRKVNQAWVWHHKRWGSSVLVNLSCSPLMAERMRQHLNDNDAQLVLPEPWMGGPATLLCRPPDNRFGIPRVPYRVEAHRSAVSGVLKEVKDTSA